MLIYNNDKNKKEEKKDKGKVATYTLSRAFELATAIVQLKVRCGYLQNIHEVITIQVRELGKIDELIT